MKRGVSPKNFFSSFLLAACGKREKGIIWGHPKPRQGEPCIPVAPGQVAPPNETKKRKNLFFKGDLMNKKTVLDIDVASKRVLVRVDFNVPLDAERRITDDIRIRAALPTIQYLLQHGAAVILMSHLGRPDGQVVEKLRLTPAAQRLSELLNLPVTLAPDSVGPEVEALAQALQPGQVLLLENLRFHKAEEKNDPKYAQQLAALGDVYVNDAFGTAHRAHASTEGVAHFLPGVAGFLMEKELNFLGSALETPKRPFVAIVGGAKVSDKIAVLERLIGLVDVLLVGGGMANTFLKADGYEIGDSLVEESKLDLARELMYQARKRTKFRLPVDVVIADRFAADAEHKIVASRAVPTGWRILDIGPAAIQTFRICLEDAQTVIWNGTLGVAEMPAFAKGTEATIELLAERTQAGAITIIGGGDSAAAVEQAGAAQKMTHVSTGGGASLEFLEGRVLPGVAALQDKL
jgi:phosphoglycerate kinase